MVWKRAGGEEAEIRCEVPEENTLIEWPVHVQAPVAAVVVEAAVGSSVFYLLVPPVFQISKNQACNSSRREAGLHAPELVDEVLALKEAYSPHLDAVLLVADKVSRNTILSDRLWPHLRTIWVRRHHEKNERGICF